MNKRKLILIRFTVLSFISIPLISCDVDNLGEESGDFSNSIQYAAHDLKQAPDETSGGGSETTDGEGGFNFPDNPHDYDPNPDGLGDVEYPGLNPNNKFPPEDGGGGNSAPDPNEHYPDPVPDPIPQHDFEYEE